MLPRPVSIRKCIITSAVIHARRATRFTATSPKTIHTVLKAALKTVWPTIASAAGTHQGVEVWLEMRTAG